MTFLQRFEDIEFELNYGQKMISSVVKQKFCAIAVFFLVYLHQNQMVKIFRLWKFFFINECRIQMKYIQIFYFFYEFNHIYFIYYHLNNENVSIWCENITFESESALQQAIIKKRGFWIHMCSIETSEMPQAVQRVYIFITNHIWLA